MDEMSAAAEEQIKQQEQGNQPVRLLILVLDCWVTFWIEMMIFYLGLNKKVTHYAVGPALQHVPKMGNLFFENPLPHFQQC
ncbi:MAG: hypothetical protein D3923_16535 [Candidatus Electrothrix sp. AR3]|nr:hypothetical protein [Candidatus Electrothrix sp. AR3]